MSSADMKGEKLTLTDIGEQLKRINDHLGSQEKVLNQSTQVVVNPLLIEFVLFRFIVQTMDTRNLDTEKRFKRLEMLLATDQVNLHFFIFFD